MLIIIAAVGFVAYVNLIGNATQPVASTSPSPSVSTTPGNFPSYVAMGDSYSGWGADRTPTNTNADINAYDRSTSCLRNTKYSAQVLLAKDLGISLVDVACGGSSTPHVLDQSFQGQPPMISRINSDTILVTMTMGGNDTGLMSLLQYCIMTTECPMTGYMPSQIDAAINKLPDNLMKIYAAIEKTAPNAKIRHAGYPYIVSKPGEPLGTCTFLSTNEQKLFEDKLVKTNEAIRTTIERFAAESGKNARYVDPMAADSPFMKRDAQGRMGDGCSTSDQRYMNGLKDGIEAGRWHPNIYGQQDYYELYKASLK